MLLISTDNKHFKYTKITIYSLYKCKSWFDNVYVYTLLL